MMKHLVQAVCGSVARLVGADVVKLNFTVDERKNGQMFLTSEDLPGFSLLLDPQDVKDLPSLTKALVEPLSAYLDALEQHEQMNRRTVTVSGIHGAHPGTHKVIADVCYA